MGFNNRGKVSVDLDTDWTIYTDALPKGGVALGTVTLGQQTGALIKIGEGYLLINSLGMHELNARKVQAALNRAVANPIQTESFQPRSTGTT